MSLPFQLRIGSFDWVAEFGLRQALGLLCGLRSDSLLLRRVRRPFVRFWPGVFCQSLVLSFRASFHHRPGAQQHHLRRSAGGCLSAKFDQFDSLNSFGEFGLVELEIAGAKECAGAFLEYLLVADRSSSSSRLSESLDCFVF